MIERAPAVDLIARAGELLERTIGDGIPRASWSLPTDTAIVLGSAQQLELELPPEFPLARRGTGGGAVICDPHYLMLDIALPRRHALVIEDVAESYRWLAEWLLLELASPTLRAVTPLEIRDLPQERRIAGRLACFAGIGPYELVTTDGRKLVGLAQRRRVGGVLFQAAAYVNRPSVDIAGLLHAPELSGALAQIATLTEIAPVFAADPPLPLI